MRQIIPWPHQVLKVPALTVDGITDEVHQIWEDMIAVMDAMPGYGLAAVQLGVPLRLAVVDCSLERGQAICLANPEVVFSSEQLREHDEASPNLPGVSAKLLRSAHVKVRYLDVNGAMTESDFDGIWATSVQHQVDHLDGKMYFDRLSRTKRAMLLKRAAKYQS